MPENTINKPKHAGGRPRTRAIGEPAVYLTLPPDLYAVMVQAAKAAGQTRADYMREAVRKATEGGGPKCE